MQPPSDVPSAICRKTEIVLDRLGEHYGRPELRPSRQPLTELIQTILSQHTTDASSAKAYAELRQRYPTWNDLAAAPLDDIAASIRSAGLARQKATTIQAALCEVNETDLDRLSEIPVREARTHLTRIPGVGEKTASCVLLFGLGMPAQPVDTHIERVSHRIGISNGARTATGIQNVLEACLPSDGQTMFTFHIGMIRHGRRVCTARVPKCGQCVLTDVCDYYLQTVPPK